MAATEPHSKEDAPAFLSLMTHELAQPLSAALGSAYTLREHSDSEELDAITRDGLYDATIRNLEQFQSLLDSVRVLSEAERGRLKVALAPVWVADLFRDAEADFGTPWSRTRVIFSCEQELQIDIELMLFRQVLTNLINNADKFSPRGSLISVEARRNENEVLITVSDEGEGFPPEKAELIFERSVRLQPGKKGLGVGLYVARAIVEAHGGRIWGENTHKGAKFSILLPAGSGRRLTSV
ncbi:MAG: sensor histidine kinase, partial [Actinomycetota bacterium]